MIKRGTDKEGFIKNKITFIESLSTNIIFNDVILKKNGKHKYRIVMDFNFNIVAEDRSLSELEAKIKERNILYSQYKNLEKLTDSNSCDIIIVTNSGKKISMDSLDFNEFKEFALKQLSKKLYNLKIDISRLCKTVY